MRETTVLCEVVCGAEPAEAPNGADFALRRDDELCAHDGESPELLVIFDLGCRDRAEIPRSGRDRAEIACVSGSEKAPVPRYSSEQPRDCEPTLSYAHLYPKLRLRSTPSSFHRRP